MRLKNTDFKMCICDKLRTKEMIQCPGFFNIMLVLGDGQEEAESQSGFFETPEVGIVGISV